MSDFGFYDRPTMDDQRLFLDGAHTPAGSGLYTFRVEEYYPERHAALIYLPEFRQRMEVRLPSQGHSGPGTSRLFRPIVGAEGQGSFKGGRSAMYGGKFEVLHWNHSQEQPPPNHPDLANQRYGVHVTQTGLLHDDGTVEPSTIEILRNDGGKTEVLMGRHVKQQEHATDERQVGPSITTNEAMMVASSNKVFKAVDLADRMLNVANNGDLNDPQDLSDISRGFETMGERFDSAHVDAANSASSYGDQVYSQGEAAAISASAGDLAGGSAEFDAF